MTQQTTEDKRNHRIKSDFGTYDYYKHYLTIAGKNPVDRATFGNIIKEFNSHVRDRISTKGAEYILPRRLGKVELRKVKTEIKFDENGKVVNNLPPNWKATRELWAENKEAKKKGIKVRFTNEHTDGYTFRIWFRKYKANFKNKSIYKMRFNRDMKRKLSESIFAGRIDAFLR